MWTNLQYPLFISVDGDLTIGHGYLHITEIIIFTKVSWIISDTGRNDIFLQNQCFVKRGWKRVSLDSSYKCQKRVLFQQQLFNHKSANTNLFLALHNCALQVTDSKWLLYVRRSESVHRKLIWVFILFLMVFSFDQWSTILSPCCNQPFPKQPFISTSAVLSSVLMS